MVGIRFEQFRRSQLAILVSFWLAFGALTFLSLRGGLSNSSGQPWTVIAASVGTILGPMTGAISRHGQSCCLKCSLDLLWICLPALLGSAFLQVISFPGRWDWQWLRLTIWALGLLVWFGGGIVSLGHALS